MRIVHLATTLDDGAGIAAWRQHCALLRLGADSRVLVAQPPSRPSPDHVAILPLPTRNPAERFGRVVRRLWSPARRWQAERARIDAANPRNYEAFSLPFALFCPEDHPWLAEADVVHLHWVAGFVDYPRFFARLRKPIVWTLHDQHPYLGGFHYELDVPSNPAFARLDARCRALKRRSLLGGNHSVVGNSNWNTRLAAAAGVFPAGTHFETIYYPLDRSRYAPRDRAHAKTTLGIPADRFVIGFASTDLTNLRKGLPDLLAALAEFLRHGAPPRVTLLSFGRAPADSVRATLAAEWVHLGFLHADELKAAAYSAMDIFVAPSRAEAFGQTVIEASACGTPVIGTAVGGILEALAPELRPLACPAGDPAALAASLGAIASDTPGRIALGAAARRHVERQHEPREVTRHYLRLYENAAAAAGAGPATSAAVVAAPRATRLLAYCWPDMFLRQPGLGHMKEIARILFVEAALTARTPVLPPLYSNPFHNRGRTGLLRWADYFDWSAFEFATADWRHSEDLAAFCRLHRTATIETAAPTRAVADADTEIVVRCFPSADIFGQWIADFTIRAPARFLEPVFSRHFPAAIAAHATAVVAEIGEPNGVLHVRRGDLACPESDSAAVVALLRARNVPPDERVFILTDERNPDFGSSIRAHYPRVITEHDVAHLARLRGEGVDNYGIFRIARCVQARHDRLGLGTLRVVPVAGPAPQDVAGSPLTHRMASRLLRPTDVVSARRLAHLSGASLDLLAPAAAVQT